MINFYICIYFLQYLWFGTFLNLFLPAVTAPINKCIALLAAIIFSCISASLEPLLNIVNIVPKYLNQSTSLNI